MNTGPGLDDVLCPNVVVYVLYPDCLVSIVRYHVLTWQPVVHKSCISECLND